MAKRKNKKVQKKDSRTKVLSSKSKNSKAKIISSKIQDSKVSEVKIDLKNLKYETTKDIPISKMMVDQVIGQEDAVNVIKKAARQRRHVLLIGEPGTGKSMLGMALAELLPREKLVDVLALPNANDENQPLIRTITAGKGRELVAKSKTQNGGALKTQNIIILILAVLAMVVPWWVRSYYKSDIMFAAFFLGGMMFLVGFVIFMNVGKKMMGTGSEGAPKVIVDNFDRQHVPFYDATGAHAGALLGDVLHDPFQSGGLGTPANERVIAGMIHKAHMGVLFIDEISTLDPSTQQDLLTALQEGKYPITGQSERSAGAMVRTEAVPCQFILVAAGNVETVQHMHPALRSRIRGYGYEIFMNETMLDTAENRNKIAIFVSQEVHKDKKIPHFKKEAVEYIIEEGRRRANRKGHLSLMLRDLGGLIRAAGDVAMEEKAEYVTKDHIIKAKKIARSLEQQISDKFIERKKEYEIIVVTGKKVGRVNGLAVIGSGVNYSGIVMPIEAEVTPGGKTNEIIATGKLGEIAKEAIQNVSAIIKKYFGEDIKETKDVYVQFLQTYEGVEGDSASIAVATTIISALKKVPIKQDYAMTGSLSVRGEVLPIGGVSAKIEAAIAAGIKNVIVPKSNVQDIIVDKDKLSKIKIIPVEMITEVLEEILDWKGKEDILKKIKQRDD
jgi:Lon-like ATP-dependent protease